MKAPPVAVNVPPASVPSSYSLDLDSLFSDISKSSSSFSVPKATDTKSEPDRTESKIQEVVLDREKESKVTPIATPAIVKAEVQLESSTYNEFFEGEWKIQVEEKVELHAGVGFLLLDSVKHKPITERVYQSLANLPTYNIDKIELVPTVNAITSRL